MEYALTTVYTVTVSLTSLICLLTVTILCISEWNESDHHPDT